MRFEDLWMLPVFLPPIFFAVWLWRKKAGLKYSHTPLIREGDVSRWFMAGLKLFACIVLAILVLGFARPLGKAGIVTTMTQSRDDVILLDRSGSMDEPFVSTAEESERYWRYRGQRKDERPTKYALARAVALEFIALRPRDRLTVCVFNDQAYCLIPLSGDHEPLREWLVLPDTATGPTDIGTSVIAGLLHLKELGKTGMRTLVMIGDGDGSWTLRDEGRIEELFKETGARLYWIYTDNAHLAKYNRETGNWADSQKGLMRFARETGGRMFDATSEVELDEAMREIARLETASVPIETPLPETDLYPLFVAAAILLAYAGFSFLQLEVR